MKYRYGLPSISARHFYFPEKNQIVNVLSPIGFSGSFPPCDGRFINRRILFLVDPGFVDRHFEGFSNGFFRRGQGLVF